MYYGWTGYACVTRKIERRDKLLDFIPSLRTRSSK